MVSSAVDVQQTQSQQQEGQFPLPVAPPHAAAGSAMARAAGQAGAAQPALYAPNMPPNSVLNFSDLLRTGGFSGNPLLQAIQQPQAVSTLDCVQLCSALGPFELA